MPKTEEERRQAKSQANKKYQMKATEQKNSAQKAQTEAINAKKNALLFDANLLRTGLKKRLGKFPLDGNGQMTLELVESVAEYFCDHYTNQYDSSGNPDLGEAKAKMEALLVYLESAVLLNTQTKDGAYDQATTLFGNVTQNYADLAVKELVSTAGWKQGDLEHQLKLVELSEVIIRAIKLYLPCCIIYPAVC